MSTSLAMKLSGTILLDDSTTCAEAWIADGRFWLERPSEIEPVAELHGWFMPGLVDLHCHIGLGLHGAVNHAQARAQAIADRDSGVLLIRDAGSPLDTRWMRADPSLPIIVRAGQHIAREKRYIRNYAREVSPGRLVDEMIRQAAAGDGWVKIVADWIDRDSGDLAPLWAPSEIAEAIAAVHELGVRVTAHVFGSQALWDLLDADVDSLEHATGADEATAARIASQGVPVIPTMIQRGNFANIAQAAGKFPRFAARMNQMHHARLDQLAMLADQGVTLLAGTDAGGTIGHGLMASELSQWELAGLSTAAIVNAATWAARDFLGYPGLVDGGRADIVGLQADPRENLSALTTYPIRVILGGSIVR